MAPQYRHAPVEVLFDFRYHFVGRHTDDLLIESFCQHLGTKSFYFNGIATGRDVSAFARATLKKQLIPFVTDIDLIEERAILRFFKFTMEVPPAGNDSKGRFLAANDTLTAYRTSKKDTTLHLTVHFKYDGGRQDPFSRPLLDSGCIYKLIDHDNTALPPSAIIDTVHRKPQRGGEKARRHAHKQAVRAQQASQANQTALMNIVSATPLCTQHESSSEAESSPESPRSRSLTPEATPFLPVSLSLKTFKLDILLLAYPDWLSDGIRNMFKHDELHGLPLSTSDLEIPETRLLLEIPAGVTLADVGLLVHASLLKRVGVSHTVNSLQYKRVAFVVKVLDDSHEDWGRLRYVWNGKGEDEVGNQEKLCHFLEKDGGNVFVQVTMAMREVDRPGECPVYGFN